MGNARIFSVALLLILLLTACAEREIVPLPVADDYDVIAGATPSAELRIGLVPGLYAEMFNHVIQPLLDDMGYATEVVYYGSYAAADIALDEGRIDLNMCQHYESLTDYKFSSSVALSAIAEVPTAPMGIYSSFYNSIKDIENGAKVSIPAEGTELSRALLVLENAGLLTIDPGINKSEAGMGNVISNPYKLEISTYPASTLSETLTFCQLSVIDGGYAVKDQLALSDAIYHEVMDKNYLVVIAVRTDSLHAQFVSDIITIVSSDEYKNAIAKEDGAFADCQRPRSFYR